MEATMDRTEIAVEPFDFDAAMAEHRQADQNFHREMGKFDALDAVIATAAEVIADGDLRIEFVKAFCSRMTYGVPKVAEMAKAA